MIIEVEGTDKVINYVKEMEKKLKSDDVKKYLAEKMIILINRESKNKLENSINYDAHNKYEILDDGILIYNDVQNDNGEYYSLIIEYGSGVYAEGEPFHHTESYDNSGGLYWLVPVENGSSLMNTGFDIITLESGDYFKVYGQEAKHIYTDAATKIQKNINRWLKEYIEKL